MPKRSRGASSGEESAFSSDPIEASSSDSDFSLGGKKKGAGPAAKKSKTAPPVASKAKAGKGAARSPAATPSKPTTKVKRSPATKGKGPSKPSASASKSSSSNATAPHFTSPSKVDLLKKKPVRVRKQALADADIRANAAQEEALRAAKDMGMLAGESTSVAEEHELPFPSAFVTCNNKELRIRKSKHNYLMLFPGLLATLQPGTAGTLENIGTSKPILNIECAPSKRTLRLFGSVVAPKTTLLPARLNNKGKEVTCESAFKHIIVFHQCQWVDEASGESGPLEEIPCPEIDWSKDPPQLARTHNSYSMDRQSQGGADDDAEDSEGDSDSPERKPAAADARPVQDLSQSASDDDDDDDDDDDEEEEEDEDFVMGSTGKAKRRGSAAGAGASVTPVQRLRRKASTKSYASLFTEDDEVVDVGDADEGEGGEASGARSDEGAGRERPLRPSRQGAGKQAKGRVSENENGDTAEDVGSSSDSQEDGDKYDDDDKAFEP